VSLRAFGLTEHLGSNRRSRAITLGSNRRSKIVLFTQKPGLSMLGTVEKVGLILELFSLHAPEWGVSQVATTLGIPKSSAHELLASLTKIGLLHRLVTGRYRLGFRTLSLSQILLSSSDWRDVARQEMQHLVERLGETVSLAAMDGGQVINVDKLAGTKALHVGVTTVGGSLPAHCSALGKVILANQPWAMVRKLIEAREMTTFTPNTITSLDELQSELERVRQQGFAFGIEEAVLELCCVAAPIRNHNGEVIAAISVSVPSNRFHQRKEVLREGIIQAGLNVSSGIGFDPELLRQPGRYQWHSIAGREELRAAR
jgi:IclR family transcriptional regulator, KDG regulon repressor